MFKDRIKNKDITAIVLFGVAFPIACVMKIWHSDLWLFSERKNEARDNGYWMYKYIKETHPEQEACYVIERSAKDREKLAPFGGVIRFGSFKHYVYYLLAAKHISAHVNADSPNSRVSNFMETHGLLKNKRVFLQHGITKDRISFGYQRVSRADLFVCAAKPEYEFCKSEFGYPKGAVQLLGFARFDGLGVRRPKRQILVMPTWRTWLANVKPSDFQKSRYFKSYQMLLDNSQIINILKEYDLHLIFYPHPDLQKFVSLFNSSKERIRILSDNEGDVQGLLNDSMMLITDYSSVAFDMAYMERPVIYYQFDYEEYRKKQHPEGYFSYENDGFGPVCMSAEEVINEVKSLAQKNCRMSKQYIERKKGFFTLNDKQNSSRIFNAIKEL